MKPGDLHVVDCITSIWVSAEWVTPRAPYHLRVDGVFLRNMISDEFFVSGIPTIVISHMIHTNSMHRAYYLLGPHNIGWTMVPS